MEKIAARQKAVVIDDAYARPSPDDLKGSLQTLRRFLKDVPAAKTWFESEFGLIGSERARNYFDPLLNDAGRVLELWRRKEECPECERLLEEGLPDLVAEVAPLRLPLTHIESVLQHRNWDLHKFASLPKLDQVPAGVELVVIDYILSPDAPRDMAAKIQESTKFLCSLVERMEAAQNVNLPLIVLVSSRPNVEKRHAETFRRSVGIQGAYFHFIRKKSLELQLGPRVDGFFEDVCELESYRKVHFALRSSMVAATNQLLTEVKALELQDIAALHVGHLIHEGEALSDYLGWMLGQVLTAKLQQEVHLASASHSLPSESYRVLLGHLQPTQGIPKLFCELSSVRTASGELYKNQGRGRELRFGDIFATLTDDKINIDKILLVISQTCDLLQCKITNGHVLCVEGRGTEIKNSEAELMRATLRQFDDKGNTLIRLDEAYYQIEWQDANLSTIQQAKLKNEKGYQYIGRLNEIYALEAQHNALNRLGRIGVPVKPGYGVVFGALRLRVWNAKVEVPALLQSFDTKTIVAVLRPRIKGAVTILLSGQVKKWLSAQLAQIKGNPSFVPELGDITSELIAVLNTNPNFYFICAQSKPGAALQLKHIKTNVDAKTQEPKSETIIFNKLAVTLGNVDVFVNVTAPQGMRIQLDFEPIA